MREAQQVLNEYQIHRAVPFQHQAVGKMQALDTAHRTRRRNLDRGEADRLRSGDRSEPLEASVPMVEALQVQTLLFGVGLEAQPLAAAGAQVLQPLALALGKFTIRGARHARLRLLFRSRTMPREGRRR